MKLSKEISDALKVMGYEKLLPIQKQVIPHLLEGHDIMVKARTGSGKTAAFAIPLCEQIEWENRVPQILVIACTRELVLQITEQFKQIGRFKKIRVLSLIGKKNMDYQKQLLSQGYHVIVSTPGRLLDHIKQGNVDLSNIRYVVIDEADEMLNMGFLKQSESILEILDKNCVTAMFSATYPDSIQKLCASYLKNPHIVTLEEQADIIHCYMPCKNRYQALLDLFESELIESVIIFCATQESVSKVYGRLKKEGILVARVHGGLKQNTRIKEMERFSKGEARILIATNVAQRGLDIDAVSHIIHYDIPNTVEDYTHRCGRSGRLKKQGISILLGDVVDCLKEVYDFKVLDVSKKHDLSYLKIETIKEDKKEKWETHVGVIHLNAGKEKKLRIGDIIGALCSIDGVEAKDIGVVEVLNKMSYVEILNDKVQLVLDALQTMTIKNKKVKAELAKRS